MRLAFDQIFLAAFLPLKKMIEKVTRFFKHLSRRFFKLTTCKTRWASESINGCSSLVNNISIIYCFHSQPIPYFVFQAFFWLRICYFCSNKINTLLLKRVMRFHSWNGIDINNPKQNQRLNCNNTMGKKEAAVIWNKSACVQRYTANPQLKTHKESALREEKKERIIFITLLKSITMKSNNNSAENEKIKQQ